ncbi:sensor histidine kinase [Bradyrhizobium sp. 174]|uniref:sensor histidine kinase n=1 Tax=Bradyrhizobium sp. 174 TaxID=2782645 RepID=UPI001FFB6010|nr:sensor histidine kinase [Bradyrhizobium sp. 174]MCK1574073.1 sensor histidine kinase [Bradyrhizobium sp. 174]
MSSNDVQLKVGAHVLVQLGAELVTDVEQAILECVKNAYDADSPGCLIEVDTLESNARIELGDVEKLAKFNEPFETVKVTISDETGGPLSEKTRVAQRKLEYTGRITIEDRGDGLTPEQLRTSWLVISQSTKRGQNGQKKARTKLGRTPLGDKGLGRLGTMKLGDILLIETATSASAPLSTAQFRWTDCEVANTVDEIPVYLSQHNNVENFKGTRVSILGLRDLPEWRRKDRIYDITKSLAKLISPFEATSTFPVKVTLDNVEQSLVTITDELLKQSVAEFTFKWEHDSVSGLAALVAEARFRKRLFMSKRSKKLEERTMRVFDTDDGQAFAESLPTHRRLKGYEALDVDVYGPWFVALTRKYTWADIKPTSGATAEDPGPFSGAFYFFHFDSADEDNDGAASGMAIDKKLIKGMSGISILRDGFRVRSQGDWLELSAGMTSGSTYNMRPDNTVGYFSLSGQENYRLVEKSDREGFVEDAAFRGFFEIASACKKFANDALENVRRSLDEYAREARLPKDAKIAATPEGSLQVVEENLRSAREAKDTAESVAAQLQEQIDEIRDGKSQGPGTVTKALRVANAAVKAMETVKSQLAAGTVADLDLVRLKHEFEDRNERAISLLESAAVGLSARGLAHELRTHITEIRQLTTTLEKAVSKKSFDSKALVPSLRAIRASCNAIVNAATLIDPMLPRTRAVKEAIDLRELAEAYVKTRETTLDRAGIKTSMSGASRTVRANRSRLIQVLDNLVRNSIYWLRRGEATNQTHQPKKISIRFTESGFVFSDSGPGVDPRFEDSLFDMFVSAKPDRDGGQGLGLFIVKQLLQIDGCDILLLNARNEHDRRYMFQINLGPLVRA